MIDLTEEDLLEIIDWYWTANNEGLTSERAEETLSKVEVALLAVQRQNSSNG